HDRVRKEDVHDVDALVREQRVRDAKRAAAERPVHHAVHRHAVRQRLASRSVGRRRQDVHAATRRGERFREARDEVGRPGTPRLRRAPRVTRAYVLGGAVVAGWFLLNVLLISEGSLARKLAALLLLWTLPTALLALSLPRPAVSRAAAAIAALGCVYVLTEVI